MPLPDVGLVEKIMMFSGKPRFCAGKDPMCGEPILKDQNYFQDANGDTYCAYCGKCVRYERICALRNK